ncbi:MAG: hypothetical protein ACYYKD_11330 [Rhodospirillales bacterium]
MAKDFLNDSEDPKQCVEQVRAIEDICSHMKEIGAGIKAGRDSLGDIFQYTYEVTCEANDASKKCAEGSKERASLDAKAKAAEMLYHLADDIRDGYFPF